MSQTKPVRRKQAFEVEPLNWVAPAEAYSFAETEDKSEQRQEKLHSEAG